MDNGVKIDNFSSQDIAVEVVMNFVRDYLVKNGRSKRVLMSRSPEGELEKKMFLAGNLLDRKRKNVGSVKVTATVRQDSDDLRLRVEWTRHVFGFWYIKEYKLDGVVEDPGRIGIGKVGKLFDPVKWTADGTVKLQSMNRMFRKMRKSRIRDRAFREGLVG